MPHIRCRGMEKDVFQKVGRDLIQSLSEIVSCPMDYITLERIESDYLHFDLGENAYPFIEVLWFERPKEIKEKVAICFTDRIQREVNQDVVVYFTTLCPQDYFENKKHF